MRYSECIGYYTPPLLFECLGNEAVNILHTQCLAEGNAAAASAWQDFLGFADHVGQFSLPIPTASIDASRELWCDRIAKLMKPKEEWHFRTKIAWQMLFWLATCSVSIRYTRGPDALKPTGALGDEILQNLAFVFQIRTQLLMEEWGDAAFRGTKVVAGASDAGQKRIKVTDEQCQTALAAYMAAHPKASLTDARRQVAKELRVSYGAVQDHTGGRTSRKK
jgi:hypothetical protein